MGEAFDKRPDEELPDGQTNMVQFQPPKDEGAKWAGDYSLLYWEIKARLSGGWLDTSEEGRFKITKPKNAVSFMNDAGIENTMATINGFITKIQAYSIYSEQRILEWCTEVDWALCMLFYVHMDEYELTPDKANVVVRIIMSMYESNLRKSIEGQALIALSQSERYVETRTTATPQKKWFGIA